MIYYETLLLFFVLLAIAPILFSFIFRKKSFRYFLWLLSLPGIFLTISTIIKHSSDIKKETGKFCGDFALDISTSKYNNAPLQLNKNISLKVNQGGTFELLNADQIFTKQKGNWKFTYNEDGGYLSCYFGSKEIRAYHSADNNEWFFEGDCLKNAQVSDRLHFVRQ